MRLRIISAVIVFAIGVLAVIAWNRNATRNAPSSDAVGPSGGLLGDGQMPAGGESTAPAPAQDPGIEWQTPKRWVGELAGGMRLAMYAVPASGSGGDVAKCAVYYFGLGQGGGVEANIERWIGEFENAGKPTRRTSEIRGLRVSRVEVSGTYLAHAGSPEGSASGASGWTLLGAIVEGPNGALFFKLTGPEGTVAAAAKEFEEMLASLRKK